MIPTTKDIRDFLEGYCLDIKLTSTFTADTLTGSPILSNVSVFTNIKRNNKITGVGIPANSRILDFDEDANTITLDTDSTATDNTVTLTVEYYQTLSDDWLIQRRDNYVIPAMENHIGTSFSEVKEVTEYYSGNGSTLLILDRRPVIEVTGISYTSIPADLETGNLLQSILLIGEQGILKSKINFNESTYTPVFAKGKNNLKITYTYGYSNLPADLCDVISYWVSKLALIHIGSRTGGGSLSGQNWSRQFGQRGKYTDVINELDGMIYTILRKYTSAVVGS